MLEIVQEADDFHSYSQGINGFEASMTKMVRNAIYAPGSEQTYEISVLCPAYKHTKMLWLKKNVPLALTTVEFLELARNVPFSY